MRRGRSCVRVKPAVVDGYKFASAGEAMRYESLKAFTRTNLRATPSTDGRLLVCEWGGGSASAKQTQAFHLAQAGANKYHARKTTVGDITFDSGREARRYLELVHLQACGEILGLQHHPPPYEFIVNNVRICRYTPDFVYQDVKTKARVVEDVKSAITRKARDYPIRKRLMLACHGITVVES